MVERLNAEHADISDKVISDPRELIPELIEVEPLLLSTDPLLKVSTVKQTSSLSFLLEICFAMSDADPRLTGQDLLDDAESFDPESQNVNLKNYYGD